jgi:hypothetical protein
MLEKLRSRMLVRVKLPRGTWNLEEPFVIQREWLVSGSDLGECPTLVTLEHDVPNLAESDGLRENVSTSSADVVVVPLADDDGARRNR